MAETTQIYTLEDLLAQRYAPLSTLNVGRINATINAYSEFLSTQMSEMLDMISEETPVSRGIWGGAPQMSFSEVGEFGKGKTKMDKRGQELHFPLYKLDATNGASEEFWKRASVNDLVGIMKSMDNGYAQRVRDEIKAAIFNNTVRTPTKDWLVDNTTLNKIQPFLNADSAEIPDAPNGDSFTASSHQHYLGITGSSLAAADVNYLVGHVREHVLGQVAIFVDPAMPAILSGLSGTKFVALTPVVTINQSAAEVARASFNPDADRNNMLVGYWDGHEVYTRSWVPTNYMAALAIGGQLGKPLWRRIDPAFPGLRVATEISDGRIRVKESYFYMGFGAFNRAAGAVLACANQGSYTVPSGLVRS